MTQLRKDLQWRGPEETFSRSGVEAMGDRIQLALGVAQQIRALGQVLAPQAIGVLVDATLPGAIRIGKEHPNREPLGQALVLGHRRHVGDLAAPVCPPRPRPARLARLTQGSTWQHILRHRDGLCREVFPHVVRILASEAPSNLFGGEAPGQVRPDVLPSPGCAP